ncbi:Sulfur oxidation protein SoxZ [invertebrate metagenome]|uniref:Sulfur oxidation protein SoxZ n=1 Tax=invertebrate metagenome TaxID=1711999 RepID=A0A484H5H5_9ZZZZ
MPEIQGRVRVPKFAKKGEIIEIKTTINHPMENGYRKDKSGHIIPKQYITEFKCIYNKKEVFYTEWYPAISSNPFFSFFIVANESGNIYFEWIENTGQVFKQSAVIAIEG